MEHGSIEREVHIDAAPEIVFDVITSPAHLEEWWPDEATLEPTPGFVGELVFGHRDDPGVQIPAITVVDAQPPRLFSFRWVYPEDEPATPTNALLVTFELTASGTGTVLRMTETGYREKGWEAAVLEETYNDHVTGWDQVLPNLVAYVDRLVAAG